MKPLANLSLLKLAIVTLATSGITVGTIAAAIAAPRLDLSNSAGTTLSYRPLVEPSLNSSVLQDQPSFPDLPPLASANTYLPGSPADLSHYIWPAQGTLTSSFGPRWGRMHQGIDIAGPVGTPIMAVASGVVVDASWSSGGYGNVVKIQHVDGSFTLYGHNQRNLVKQGQQVEQGQIIAEMGSTGNSTGPHCHFEIHLPKQGVVNPIAYLPSK